MLPHVGAGSAVCTPSADGFQGNGQQPVWPSPSNRRRKKGNAKSKRNGKGTPIGKHTIGQDPASPALLANGGGNNSGKTVTNYSSPNRGPIERHLSSSVAEHILGRSSMSPLPANYALQHSGKHKASSTVAINVMDGQARKNSRTKQSALAIRRSASAPPHLLAEDRRNSEGGKSALVQTERDRNTDGRSPKVGLPIPEKPEVNSPSGKNLSHLQHLIHSPNAKAVVGSRERSFIKHIASMKDVRVTKKGTVYYSRKVGDGENSERRLQHANEWMLSHSLSMHDRVKQEIQNQSYDREKRRLAMHESGESYSGKSHSSPEKSTCKPGAVFSDVKATSSSIDNTPPPNSSSGTKTAMGSHTKDKNGADWSPNANANRVRSMLLNNRSQPSSSLFLMESLPEVGHKQFSRQVYERRKLATKTVRVATPPPPPKPPAQCSLLPACMRSISMSGTFEFELTELSTEQMHEFSENLIRIADFFITFHVGTEPSLASILDGFLSAFHIMPTIITQVTATKLEYLVPKLVASSNSVPAVFWNHPARLLWAMLCLIAAIEEAEDIRGSVDSNTDESHQDHVSESQQLPSHSSPRYLIELVHKAELHNDAHVDNVLLECKQQIEEQIRGPIGDSSPPVSLPSSPFTSRPGTGMSQTEIDSKSSLATSAIRELAATGAMQALDAKSQGGAEILEVTHDEEEDTDEQGQEILATAEGFGSSKPSTRQAGNARNALVQQGDRKYNRKELYKKNCRDSSLIAISQAKQQLDQQQTDISVQEYRMGDSMAESLAMVIRMAKDLTSLDIRGNALTCAGMKLLIEAADIYSSLQMLQLDNNPIGPGGAGFIQEQLQSCQSVDSVEHTESRNISTVPVSPPQFSLASLRELHMSWCSLHDGGCAKVVKAVSQLKHLSSLFLAGNAASLLTGKALEQMLPSSRKLQVLDLEWNHFRTEGAMRVCSGLKGNLSLTTVKLAWNSFGDIKALQELSEYLTSNHYITELNLSSNRINDRGAALIASALEHNEFLRILNLDRNNIGHLGGRLLLKASPKLNKERQLSMQGCSVSMVHDAGLFDPAHPTANYELDMTDPYSAVVMRNLCIMLLRGKGIFATKPELNGKRWPVPDIENTDEEDWEFPKTGTLSFRYEAVLRIANDSDVMTQDEMQVLEKMFSEASKSSDREALVMMMTAGDAFLRSSQAKYLMDKYLTSPVEQASLVARCMFRLVDAHAKEELMNSLGPEAKKIFLRKTSVSSRAYTPNNPTGRYSLDLSTLTDKELFQRLLERREDAYRAEHRRRTAGREGDLPCNKGMPPERHFLRLRIDGKAVPSLIGFEVPSQGNAVFDFVDSDRPSQQVPVVDKSELWDFARPDGKLREWLYGNASASSSRSGSRPSSRPVSRGSMQSLPKSAVPDEGQSANILSAALNNCPKTSAEEDSPIPLVDVGDADDSNSKEGKDSTAVSTEVEEEEAENIDSPEDWDDIHIKMLRQLSNNKAFTLEIAAFLVDEFMDPISRVEAAVITFARCVDYHCWSQVVFRRLSRSEKEECRKRLGYHNLYDEVAAIDYFELDLEDPQQRFVMAELTRLAVLEPGENMIDETYNGVDFELPAGWTKETPTKGLYTCFYCREPDTISDLVAQEQPYTISENFDDLQPAYTDWTINAKRARIKGKLEEKFPDPDSCFNALDKDGGGSLDRKELATGLREVGVWLHPTELDELMVCLDEDGSGEVEIDELESFWYAY